MVANKEGEHAEGGGGVCREGPRRRGCVSVISSAGVSSRGQALLLALRLRSAPQTIDRFMREIAVPCSDSSRLEHARAGRNLPRGHPTARYRAGLRSWTACIAPLPACQPSELIGNTCLGEMRTNLVLPEFMAYQPRL